MTARPGAGPPAGPALPVHLPAERGPHVTTTDTWHSHHLFLHCGTEDTDAFLTRWLAPRLDGLVASGQASRWFFIRYGEDGPHLRVRVRGLSPEAAAELPGALARAAAEHPAVAGGSWPSRHGEVRAVEYVPETGRYGGPRALPTAEEVFTVSSRVAVEALRTLPAGSGGAARLAIAADLAHATAYALGMDRLAAARWLRRHASGWRWVTEVALLPGAAVHTRVHTVYASQRTALRQRARRLREALRGGGGEPWLSEWVRCVREADGRLRAGAGAEASGAVPPWVWASQLHMLFNRLGVAPDEERAVCLLAARTLLDTDDAPSFFPEGHRAADVQYLERSRFRIGLGEDSPLRPLPPSALPAGVAAAPAPPEVPLPAGPLPEVPLGAALRGRTSLRGALRGPLDAGGLGTLLWNALAHSGTSEQRLADGTVRTLDHRPYPSAGALYTARVRLLALDVAGVPAATYDCVPERRTLRPVGPVPSPADVTSLSAYFSRPPHDPDRIGVDEAPVLLGVYVDLGLLRRRYGLRALRLALLEAGHLTQTLLLAAGALGLGGTPLGGFHDDLAQELFGLDDLDHPLQYLLPLGRRPAD
ncbi:thiopeptide-type bacteriocin biosynthesis protein [Streptomyces sudanensis]|uniref:Thiopeptide-type bacteriocin biosynthesis protein n=1 Tax=Streptomyces sudanensis TaxID=436397 RepID=A0ABY4TJ38_9ACTN|nr:thiopeptide-type bacteriocin biosynthesis protein [Streptomyces sudanensis]URN18930.1 thiopeptide-type bacteriocin biosynthesis protein [Streptomyces sudanensis]